MNISRRHLFNWIAIVTSSLCLLMGIRLGASYADAAALLARVEQPSADDGLAAFRAYPVGEQRADFEWEGESVRARRYVPEGSTKAPGVVLLHGIHRLGIDEPRLVGFARALAASGIIVFTPELRELAEYRISEASIPTIGAAASILAGDGAVLPGGVGMMGFSFAGGLALLAAAEPAYASSVKAVLAVGAHGDLGRVARFFATNEALEPDGSSMALRAHDYGALVLVHGHAHEFFSEEDAAGAEEALRLWLWQEWDAARERAASLSLEGRAKIEQLFEGKLDAISKELLAWAGRHGPSLAAVSPSGKLGSLRAKVFLLHGAGDDVVPAAETRWLSRDLPEEAREAVLISQAVQHVEPGKSATILEQARLVHFIQGLLVTLREPA